MPIPLGILASQVAPDLGAFELISTQIITTTAASVTFSSIPQDYKHLQIRLTARDNRSSLPGSNIRLRFNSATSTYRSHGLAGNGSTVASGTEQQNTIRIGDISASTAAANIFGAAIVDILDPFSTTKNTTVRSLNGLNAGGINGVEITSGAWFDTSAVNSITLLTVLGTTFINGSRFSLYGIRG